MASTTIPMMAGFISWATAPGSLRWSIRICRKGTTPLRTAEMTVEDDYGMIDGVINNGRRDESEKKPSIWERLENAKRECVERKPPEVKRPGRDTPEHGDL